MPIGQRLRIGNIERSADAACIQRVYESIRVDNRPARGVDQQRALTHQSELRRRDEMMRLCSRRKNQDDDLRLRKERIELADGVNFWLRTWGAGHARELHLE